MLKATGIMVEKFTLLQYLKLARLRERNKVGVRKGEEGVKIRNKKGYI